jgi:hypothetical protein
MDKDTTSITLLDRTLSLPGASCNWMTCRYHQPCHSWIGQPCQTTMAARTCSTVGDMYNSLQAWGDSVRLSSKLAWHTAQGSASSPGLQRCSEGCLLDGAPRFKQSLAAAQRVCLVQWKQTQQQKGPHSGGTKRPFIRAIPRWCFAGTRLCKSGVPCDCNKGNCQWAAVALG